MIITKLLERAAAKPEPKEIVSFRVSPDVAHWLEELATQMAVSKSAVGEECLTAGLNQAWAEWEKALEKEKKS